MRRVAVLPMVVILTLAGCKKADITGRWNFPMPGLPMQIEFKADGTYSGSAMGGVAQVTGTYKVEGNVLAMNPPQITGPAGSASPPGGQMRLKMTPAGPDAYTLTAPGVNLTMSRIPGTH